MDWQGQTFYITGKESVIATLRDTSSVRTLMEDGQFWSTTWEISSTIIQPTILRLASSKSVLLAGMTLTLNTDHDLDRLQSLACYAIKELQDNCISKSMPFLTPGRRTVCVLMRMRMRVVLKLRLMIPGFGLGKVNS